MLTKKQHELLLFVSDRLSRTGISPSFDEMKDALDLKSKSGIHRLITALEERGFIRRLPHRARALEVLRLPAAAAPAPTAAESPQARPGPFAPNVIEGDFSAALPGREAANDTPTMELPLYGRIAAGTPIEALRDQTTTVAVPAGFLGKGEYYALEVAGDSMVEAGIHDGDTAVIERCQTAGTGQIVVALIDNEEVTLKRLRRKGDSVALEAANPRYETRIFGPDRVKVQGRLAALMRRYH